MIFDDLLLERQNKCECYYILGGHSNVDCFYLLQNYFKLPRQTIKGNADFICFFPQDLKNINHIYSDHVDEDMYREEFRKFCRCRCWRSFGLASSGVQKGMGVRSLPQKRRMCFPSGNGWTWVILKTIQRSRVTVLR